MAALRPRSGAATDAAVLDAIRRVPDTTRTALAAELGVTAVTVTNSVKRLLAEGLVVEVGRARSTGGKPASLLRVNTASRWALGCTIERDRLSVVAMNMDGALRFRTVVPLADPAADAERLTGPLRELRERIDEERGGCAGVGIADLREDVAAAEGIRALLEAELDLPVRFGSPALCAGLGSYWVGEQEDSACLTVHLGPSIGAVVLSAGVPVLPERPGSSALDHVVLDPAGEPCSCGARGCLHLVASAAADVHRAAREGLAEELELDPGEARVITDHARLTEAAAHGHEGAARIVLDSARAIALVIGNMIGPLGLRQVVLSGTSVSMAPRLYRDAVGAALCERAAVLGEDVRVTVSSVQPHPCSVGAAALALTTALRP